MVASSPAGTTVGILAVAGSQISTEKKAKSLVLFSASGQTTPIVFCGTLTNANRLRRSVFAPPFFPYRGVGLLLDGGLRLLQGTALSGRRRRTTNRIGLKCLSEKKMRPTLSGTKINVLRMRTICLQKHTSRVERLGIKVPTIGMTDDTAVEGCMGLPYSFRRAAGRGQKKCFLHLSLRSAARLAFFPLNLNANVRDSFPRL